jgi:hypothetical protein
MRSKFRICFGATAVTVAALGATGCSSGGSSTPTSNDYDDVAQSTAALVITPGGGGETASVSDVVNIALGVTGNVTVSAQGGFSTVEAGVTYSFVVSCADAAGKALSQCGPTTNTAQASVSWNGDLSIPDFTATVARSGTWTVAGLQTGTATFNGTGSFNYASQFQSAFRNEMATASLVYDATYDGVVYDEASHLVTGGTIDYTVNASRMASSTSGSSSGSFTIDAVVTFANGGATIVLDGSHAYQVSAAGVIIKV